MQFVKGGGMPTIPVGPKPLDVSQATDFSKQLGKPDSAQKGKFDAVLKGAAQDKSGLTTNVVNQTQNASAISATRAQEIKKPPETQKVKSSEKSSPVKNLMGSLASSQDSMNSLVKMSMSGQTFSPQQLITMQAGVYKSTMALNVAGQAMGSITSGLKTLFQTQV